ncbi:hypothetical protein TNCV_4009591 [Trichonephila clavipes]|nr:hypothetical protein TNCV_4009591 [Trichonephila clavipes]
MEYGSHDFKQIQLAMSAEVTTILVARSSTKHNLFQVVPEEEIYRIEVREAWRQNNRSTTSNPPPGICSIEVNLKMCCCTIVREPHVSGVQWPFFPAETSGEVGNLPTCTVLQPYHDAPNPLSRLSTPLVWIFVLTITIIVISID